MEITRTKLACNHEFVQYHAGRGGWSPWVSPKMKGYEKNVVLPTVD